MSNQEWAQLISVVGFCGYGVAMAVAMVNYIRTPDIDSQQRISIGSSSFVILIAVVSAVGQLTRAPFKWLTASDVGQVNSFIVWLFFFIVVIGLRRRKPEGKDA